MTGLEIFLSNIAVAKVILDPRLPIHPTLIRVKTNAAHRLARELYGQPYEVVSVGDVITVWVHEIDKGRRRVSLTATAPTDAEVILKSVTGIQFSPPSVVFHSPPPVAPK